MERLAVPTILDCARVAAVLAVALGLALGSLPARAQDAFDDLVANLKSPTARTRLEAARKLGESRRREAVAPLAALVRDPEPKVRLEVVRALTALRDLSGVPSLVTSLQDGDPAVREEAISALVEIYTERDRTGPVGRFLENFSDEYERSSVPPYTTVDPSVFPRPVGRAQGREDAHPGRRRVRDRDPGRRLVDPRPGGGASGSPGRRACRGGDRRSASAPRPWKAVRSSRCWPTTTRRSATARCSRSACCACTRRGRRCARCSCSTAGASWARACWRR
jgi:hypothetical protein